MKKILIIEDDEPVKIGLNELLENDGYKVLTASNGKDGVNIANKFLPDLIICDIMMPKMSGYDVKTEVDKNIKTSTIPFIFLTAKAEMNDLRTGMLLGADDYIIKPFKSSDLLKAIELRIDRNQKIKDSLNQMKTGDVKKNKVNGLNEDDHIFIDTRGKPHFLSVGDIVCITAHGNNSIIKLSELISLSQRRTLSAWEKLLPPNIFRRIHRSAIINLNYVESISRWSSGTYIIHLKGIKETYTVSQRYAKQMRDELN